MIYPWRNLGNVLKAPQWPWPKQRYQPDGNEERDTLDRLWVLVEYGSEEPEEMLDKVSEILSAYRYGQTVASTRLSEGEKEVLKNLKAKKK